MKKVINSKNIKSASNFPYLVLDVKGKVGFPHNPGFLVMHWHTDLQLVLVQAGQVEIRLLGREPFSLTKGEGLFLNKDVTHQILPSDQAHYHSFIFPDYFLKFYLASPAQKLVNRLLDTFNLSYLIFKSKVTWQKQILSILNQLVDLETRRQGQTYPYEVLVNLSRICLLMQKNIQPVEQKGPEQIQIKRMRLFLTYLQKHYSEKIKLSDLAAQAHVSKSACLRCFHILLNTTPYNYLMNYRLNEAARLLQNSTLPVAEIAHRVGFKQVSHFGQLFRQKTGYLPLAFRRE